MRWHLKSGGFSCMQVEGCRLAAGIVSLIHQVVALPADFDTSYTLFNGCCFWLVVVG